DSSDFIGASGLALDPNGGVYVAGGFATEWAGRTSAGGLDGFVAKLDGDGTLRWATAFGGAGDEYAYSIAASSDRVAVGGTFESGGTYRAFIAEYTVLDGAPAARRDVAGADWNAVNALAFDSSGNLLAGGTFGTGADLGGGAVTTIGPRDAFVAKYDASLSLV